MNNNIDQLKTEVNNITNSLKELKDNVAISEDEKKKQAEALKVKAETTKQKIQAEISTLDTQTGVDIDRQKAEAQALLASFNEIMNLYASIISPVTPNTPATTPGVPTATNEEKGFFGKTGDWIGEQWSDVISGDKRKEQPGSNVLRAVGFGLTGYAAYKGVKALWNRAFGDKDNEEEGDDSEDEETESKSKKKKKSFWKSGWGKFLKWTGIGAGAYYVVHGLKTGKWGLGYLFDWKENSPTSTKGELYDSYTELFEKEPEKYKEYEKFGENVNTMYDEIWRSERQYFGDDSQIVLGEIGDRAKEEKLQKTEKFKDINTRGLVPYSLDNFYANVGELLSYGGVSKYLRAKNIEEYKQKITNFGADWFDKTMVPFLSSFANFATFGILSSDTAQQKMDKYFNGIRDNAEDNLQILDLFFRQYTKVLTYMADKKNALASKKAREIISVQGYDGEAWPSDPDEQEEMIHEAINDTEWLDKNLKGTSYGAFLGSSILGAHKILENENISQNEMTDELREIVDDVDGQTEKLIGGFDNNAFVKAEAKLNGGGTLDASEKMGLKEVADNILEDLGDTKKGGWLYETFDYGFELLGLEEADRQMILKESGIADALNGTVSQIQKLQSEVFTNPTKENVNQLKKLVGEYTSMKKEVAVALYAIQEAKENKDLGDYVMQVLGAMWTGFEHFLGSLNDLIHWRADVGDIINIFIGATISGGILELGGRLSGKKLMVRGGRIARKVGLVPRTLTVMGLGRTRWSWMVKKRIKNLQLIKPAAAENLLRKKVIEGVLSPRKVKDIVIGDKDLMVKLGVTTSDTKEKIFKSFVTEDLFEGAQEQADLFIKYYGKTKGLITWSRADVMDGGFTSHAINIEPQTQALNELKKFDAEIQRLGSNSSQRKFFDSMIKKSKSADDLECLNRLITNQEFKNKITGDTVKKLRKLKISDFKTLESNGNLGKFLRNEITLDIMLKELKGVEKVVEDTVEEVVETAARKAFNASIDKAIAKLNEVANPSAVAHHIKQLEALKKDATLVDDEMECFVKFIDEGFDAKLIPELKKLINITDTFREGEKIGDELKKLLSAGKYEEFKSILRQPDLANVFKKIKVDDVLKNFDKVLLKGGSAFGAETAKLLKSFFKVLAKVL